VTVENIQQVRAVWNGDHWELHLTCKVEIPVEDTPGDNTAGIDLGISNHLAIAYDDGDAELYPGNVLKQDKHYFTRDEYNMEGENGPSSRALTARQKLSRRKDHFLYTLAKHIVTASTTTLVISLSVSYAGFERMRAATRGTGASVGTRNPTDGGSTALFTRIQS
jgi:transposase